MICHGINFLGKVKVGKAESNPRFWVHESTTLTNVTPHHPPLCSCYQEHLYTLDKLDFLSTHQTSQLMCWTSMVICCCVCVHLSKEIMHSWDLFETKCIFRTEKDNVLFLFWYFWNLSLRFLA